MRFSKSILLAAATLALPFFSQATTLKVDGLTFSNFTCVFHGSGSGTPTSCSGLSVNTITDPAPGIQITGALTASGKNASTDAQINYHLTATSGISEIGLAFDGQFYGKAIAAVTEMVYSGGKEVGFASVRCGAGKAGCQMSDDIMLSGSFTNLYIEKDILLASFGVESGAYASYIDQTFKDATATPEPSSIALLGSGLLGAAGLLRRRKAAVKA